MLSTSASMKYDIYKLKMIVTVISLQKLVHI